MTKIVFENAALAAAVKKAAQVAPSRGAAFDKANGILLEITPGEELPVALRATDLNVFFSEWVNVLEADGPETVMRVPALQLQRIASSLPIGSGKTCTFEEKDGKLLITSGRTRATLNMLSTDYFPRWDVFDPAGMQTVNALGARINQVAWASSKEQVAPLNGIHFDGEYVLATDRYRIAKVPCEIDLAEPITIPNTVLTNVIKDMAEAKVAVRDGMLLVMPDTHTQIKLVTFGDPFPGLTKAFNYQYDDFIVIDKDHLSEVINRCGAIGAVDRMPVMRTWIGLEEFAVMMENGEIGKLGDVIALPGQAHHTRTQMLFTPQWILDAIALAPDDTVKLHYNAGRKFPLLHVDGGAGYQAWVMTRADLK